MARKRITFDVDETYFCDAAERIDRWTLGDRFVELCLRPDDIRTQFGLAANYSITIVDVQPAPEEAPAK